MVVLQHKIHKTTCTCSAQRSIVIVRLVGSVIQMFLTRVQSWRGLTKAESITSRGVYHRHAPVIAIYLSCTCPVSHEARSQKSCPWDAAWISQEMKGHICQRELTSCADMLCLLHVTQFVNWTLFTVFNNIMCIPS